jgi:hypothetical protein
MSKIQTRRSVSLSRKLYDILKAKSEAEDISMSKIVETLLLEAVKPKEKVEVIPVLPTPPAPIAPRVASVRRQVDQEKFSRFLAAEEDHHNTAVTKADPVIEGASKVGNVFTF